MKSFFNKTNSYPFLSFFIPLVLYVFTLSPSIHFGDTGELITAAYTLGIPHPPGSPIWVLFAKIFTFLPVGNIAYRVNLASAAFAAISALVLFFLCKKLLIYFIESLEKHSNPLAHFSKKQLKKQPDTVESSIEMDTERLEGLRKFIDIISFSSALTFAVLLPVWTFAVVTEVYTLNLLFTALILYCAVAYLENENTKYLYTCAFLFGLAVTNHYLILFLGLAGFTWLLIHKRDILFNGKIIAISSVCILAGLTVFLYLPIRSGANPPIDWGNPETVENFIAVIGRKQFTGGKVAASPLTAPQELNNDIVFRSFQAIFVTFQSAYISYGFFIIVILLGLYASIRYIRSFYAPFLYSFLFGCTALAFAINYAITPGDRASTFIAADLSLSIAGAVGTMYAIYFLSGTFKSIQNKSGELMISTIVMLIPLTYIILNYSRADMSKNNIARIHAQKILELVPANAIIFTEENNWLFPLLYMQAVEKMRPDVTIYDRNGNLFGNIYADIQSSNRSEDDFERKRRALEKALIAKSGRPAYYAVDKSFENYGYTDLSTEGILYKQGPARNIDYGKFYKEILEINPSEYSKYYGSEYTIAYYHLQYGESLKRQKKVDSALKHYDLAAEWGKNEAIILNNLGVIYSQMGETNRAKNVLLQAIKVNNRNIRANKNLGVIYFQEGNMGKAEEYYMNALTINSQHLETIISLSLLYEQTGRREKALQGYRFALSLDPQNEELQQKVQELSQ